MIIVSIPTTDTQKKILMPVRGKNENSSDVAILAIISIISS